MEEQLAADVDGDFFRFMLTRVAEAGTRAGGAIGWRVSVTASLAGRPFDHVRLDVVPRVAEVEGGTETVVIAPPVPGLDLAAVHIRAVDRLRTGCRRRPRPGSATTRR